MNKVDVVSYSSSGDMMGGSYSIRVTLEDNKVKVEEKKSHNHKNMIRIYKYDNLETINKIVNEYHLLDAVPLDAEIVHASDAPTTSLYIKSGDKSIAFKGEIYSDEVIDGNGKLLEYIESLKDEEHLVEEHEAEPLPLMGFIGMGMGIPNDKK